TFSYALHPVFDIRNDWIRYSRDVSGDNYLQWSYDFISQKAGIKLMLAVYIFILMALAYICWKSYRLNSELFWCIMIAINFELFYLVPDLLGPDGFKLLLIPVVLIVFFESYLNG